MQLSETNQLIYGHKKQIIKYIMVWIFGVAWILLGLLSGGKDTFPSYGIIIYYLLWVWVLLLTPAIILLMIVSLVRKTSFTVMWENDQLIVSRSIDPFNEDITIKVSDIEKLCVFHLSN